MAGVEIKTTGFNSFVAAANKYAAGPPWERIKRALPEETLALVQNPPDLVGWMDAEHYYVMLDKVVWAGFDGKTDALREIARMQVDADLRGVLRLLVRVASPEFVAARAATLYGSYWRGQGGARAEKVSDREVHVVYTMPIVRPLFVHTQLGAVLAATAATGVKNPKTLLGEMSTTGFRVRAMWG
jgi:hypothetical protein